MDIPAENEHGQHTPDPVSRIHRVEDQKRIVDETLVSVVDSLDPAQREGKSILDSDRSVILDNGHSHLLFDCDPETGVIAPKVVDMDRGVLALREIKVGERVREEIATTTRQFLDLFPGSGRRTLETMTEPLSRERAEALKDSPSDLHVTVRVRVDQQAYVEGYAAFVAGDDSDHFDLMHEIAFDFGIPHGPTSEIIGVDGDDLIVEYTTDLVDF